MTQMDPNRLCPKRTLTVLRPGPLALIQDAGRVGHAADGVGRSGAADRRSYALANSLVGNASGAAAIECMLGGLAVRAETDLVIAVTGASTPVDIDGAPVEPGSRICLSQGQTLRLRSPRSGLRNYLAVRGGIVVPTVLGSRSSDTLSGLGPTALAKGDELPIGPEDAQVAPAGAVVTEKPADGAILGQQVTCLRVMFGPRDDWFVDPATLTTGEWQVSPNSNRVGLRLDRPTSADGESISLQRSTSREMPSEGLPLGAIQVPPSGQPVLFLADHPLTGGYPVIAVVLDDDIDLAAQVRPGQRLRFVLPANS